MKRTFIAIDIPYNKSIKDFLDIVSQKLTKERIKWQGADNLHLTLKFLGETDEQLLDSIGLKLSQLAIRQTEFSCSVGKVGVFKNIGNPTIIWLGIEACHQLLTLKNLIDKNLVDFGFPPEARNFSPHLTIGRVKFLLDKKMLQQIIQEYQDKLFLQFVVSEIIFYESILSYKGPEYISLGRFTFKGL